jgi:MOSC domain-containing protein YiiM
MPSTVIAVSKSEANTFSKANQTVITVIEGIGIEGDVHSGKTVKHRFLMEMNPTAINLRQVHIIHRELLDELNSKGFSVKPGELGENITTNGVDVLSLPTGTKLKFGSTAIVELTGLRNPCYQVNDFQKGMVKAVLDKDEEGNLIRKIGVMGIALVGGDVRPGDEIEIQYPSKPYKKLEYIE